MKSQKETNKKETNKEEKMKTFKKALLAVALAVVLMPLSAWAKPEVKINVIAEKEIVIVEAEKKIVKRVPADSVKPGETIFYTLSVANQGDEKATHIVVNNPIPQGAFYVNQSAFGKQSIITFSADNGATFNLPGLLKVETTSKDGKIEKKAAKPVQYTTVRWTIDEISPGKTRILGFQATVK